LYRGRDEMYAIQSNGGEWWSGECWGVAQARQEYASRDDLPEYLHDRADDDNGPLVMEVHAPEDIRYYRGDDIEASAGVREV